MIKGPEDPNGTLYQIPTIGGESKKILRDIETPVTFSPDAKRLAFVRAHFPKEGESSLLAANPDGTQETLLLTKRPPEYLAPIFFGAPAWSHNGTRIALPLRIRNDQAKLISVDVATRKEMTLSGGPWTHTGEVAWLPEDRGLLLIASTGMGQTREAQLWYVNSRDGKHRQITNDLFAYRITSLSADGKSLVTVAADTTADVWVTSLQGESAPRKITKGKYEGLQAITSGPDGSIIYNSVGSSPDGDLWVTDYTGAKARQLTSDDGPNADAVITPDGRFIVWVGIREGDWTLLRMNRDGSDVRQLCTLRPVDSPSITPDSQWVFFSAAPTGIWTLWKVPIDGGEPVQLTTYPTLGPSVSPDGKHIAAMVRPSPDRGLTLVTIPIEGGRPTREFEATGTNFSMVRWSPDGRGLIHNSGPNDRINLWFQPLEGGPPRRITNFDDQYVLRFDVSADGKHLLVVRGVLSRDAVLITNFPTSAEESR